MTDTSYKIKGLRTMAFITFVCLLTFSGWDATSGLGVCDFFNNDCAFAKVVAFRPVTVSSSVRKYSVFAKCIGPPNWKMLTVGTSQACGTKMLLALSVRRIQ